MSTDVEIWDGGVRVVVWGPKETTLLPGDEEVSTPVEGNWESADLWWDEGRTSL